MSQTIKEILCQWQGCQKAIPQPKKGQRFCNSRCRLAWHKNEPRSHGIPGVISSLRLLKGGKISMVLRFDDAERNRVTAFSQGQKIKVIEIAPPTNEEPDVGNTMDISTQRGGV